MSNHHCIHMATKWETMFLKTPKTGLINQTSSCFGVYGSHLNHVISYKLKCLIVLKLSLRPEYQRTPITLKTKKQ